MSDLIIGLFFCGPIILIAIFAFIFSPRKNEYEWKKHMAAKDRWIEMMEGKK